MIFRALTALGDWTFGTGISGYLTGEAAIEANIVTRIKSWKNDCFFALDDCVDWLARLDRNQETNLQNELRNVILQSFGVVSVDSIVGVLNRNTRNYQVTYSITTIFGPGFISTLNISAGVPTGT